MTPTAISFDELRLGATVTSEPVVITRADLDDFLRLTGEIHPLHSAGDVVPAGFLHSRAAGALIAADRPWQVVGLRRMTWNFTEAVRVGVPFRVVSEVIGLDALTPSVGSVTVQRRLHGLDGTLLARATLEVAVARTADEPGATP